MLDKQIFDQVKQAAAWQEFVRHLREDNRFFSSSGYLDELLRALGPCRRVIPKGLRIFRARIMPIERDSSSEPLPVIEMGPPPRDRVSGGRLNPEGIPYLYGALDSNTAIAEVRPWVGARLTVLELQVTRTLEIVDLTVTPLMPMAAWFAFMAMRPVHREDRWAYLGTQYVAEKLKADGINGLLYDSSVSPAGINVAVFDIEHWLPAGPAALVEVSAVSIATSLLVRSTDSESERDV